MKTIYFVRHGESETNAGPVRIGDNAALTDVGKQQADFITKRCHSLPIDIVISSTMQRAKETAEIINSKLKKPIEYSDLFVERRRPSEQVGVPKDNPESLKAEKAIWENYCVPGWHYSDEENFEDIKDRAKKAMRFLENRPEENILVVTHGFFLRIVMAYVTFGSDVPAEAGELFVNKFHMANSGLTILKYDEQSKRTPWWLWTWNDHAHLAE